MLRGLDLVIVYEERPRQPRPILTSRCPLRHRIARLQVESEPERRDFAAALAERLGSFNGTFAGEDDGPHTDDRGCVGEPAMNIDGQHRPLWIGTASLARRLLQLSTPLYASEAVGRVTRNTDDDETLLVVPDREAERGRRPLNGPSNLVRPAAEE